MTFPVKALLTTFTLTIAFVCTEAYQWNRLRMINVGVSPNHVMIVNGKTISSRLDVLETIWPYSGCNYKAIYHLMDDAYVREFANAILKMSMGGIYRGALELNDGKVVDFELCNSTCCYMSSPGRCSCTAHGGILVCLRERSFTVEVRDGLWEVKVQSANDYTDFCKKLAEVLGEHKMNVCISAQRELPVKVLLSVARTLHSCGCRSFHFNVIGDTPKEK